MRDGDLVAIGVLFEDAVVALDGSGVAASAIVDLGLIVIGVSREGIVGVVLDDVAELGGSKGVFRGHVVAEGGLVEIVGGGNGWTGKTGRRGGGCHGKRTVCRGLALSYDGSRRGSRGSREGIHRDGRGRGWGCATCSWRVLHVGAHGLLLALDVLHQLLERAEARLDLVDGVVQRLDLSGELVDLPTLRVLLGLKLLVQG